MFLLIDPPVTPWHSVDAILDWVDELVHLRHVHGHDPEALTCIARAETGAAAMLECARAKALPDWEAALASHLHVRGRA